MESKEDKIKLPNLLLIAGSGRNTGKTSVACNILSEISQLTNAFAIKVSPHFHHLTDNLKVILEMPGLIIAEEKDYNSGKDSSRFLRSGATRSWYVQGKDFKMKILAEWLKNNIPTDIPVVCESGGIGKFIIPGGAIYIKSESNNKFPEWEFDYKTIRSNLISDEFKVFLKWDNYRWII